ncbi:MAG: ATP cone domain-containing protein, partial [Candidatus Hodarchaeales archaeon]
MFSNEASKFIYIRTYSRWIDEFGRRECWEETVERYIDFIIKHVGDRVPQKVFRKAREYILNMCVMPSMRAFWTAGPAAEFDNTCMYNCSFQAIDCVDAFAECLYILMCGAGYGFSVESKYINKLPEVPHLTPQSAGT